ncbi:membrane protein [Yersinia pestis 24H]|nr:membrane protein [Yersinia pestis 24H]
MDFYIIVFSMIYWPVVAAMCVGLIVAAVLRKRWFIIIFAVPLALIALSFITLMLM